jgi:hypothetical protein
VQRRLAREGKRQFERLGTVIVPGEWVDCHRSGMDPSASREIPRPFESGTRASQAQLERQSGGYAAYRAPALDRGQRAVRGAQRQGSNNNLGRSAAMDTEYRERMPAVLDWMRDSLRVTRERQVAGMLIFAQADPDFEGRMRRRGGDGFAGFRDALRDLAVTFGKPVLFVNGDTHLYKLDKPLLDPGTGRPLENFTRVVVFGSPQTRWIRAGIDASTPQLFELSPQP